MDIIDILKEFTRTYLVDLVGWLMTTIVTTIFGGIPVFLFLHMWKKSPGINVIPIILMSIAGGSIPWASQEFSWLTIALSTITGGAMGYWLDRYCARHIGEKISGVSKSFSDRLSGRSKYRPRPSTSSRSSSPKSSNSNFGGGNFSGGGGSSSW